MTIVGRQTRVKGRKDAALERARVTAAFAVEECISWRCAAEELARAGISAHLTEPADAETRSLRRRANRDPIDARTLTV